MTDFDEDIPFAELPGHKLPFEEEEQIEVNLIEVSEELSSQESPSLAVFEDVVTDQSRGGIEVREFGVTGRSPEGQKSNKIVDRPTMQQREGLVSHSSKREEKWQAQNTFAGRWVLRWATGGVVAVLLLVLGYLFLPKLFPKTFDRQNQPLAAVKKLVHDDSSVDSKLLWYAEGGVALREKALDILKSFIEAESKAEKAGFLRYKDNFLEADESWFQFDEIRLDAEHEHVWALEGSEETPYLSFSGRTKDFEKCKIIFVRSSEGLVIDWDASVGWSSKRLDQLGSMESLDSATVRCVLEMGQVYSDVFPEDEFSCYLIAPLGGSGDSVLWGYTPLKSVVDEELRKKMNYGMFNMELKEKLFVTLRVSIDPARRGRSQLMIDEVLHESWVQPEVLMEKVNELK